MTYHIQKRAMQRSNPTLHVISTAYGRPIELRMLIDNFLIQSNPNWKLYIVYDGEAPSEIRQVVSGYADQRISFKESEIRCQQYGHPNRRIALRGIVGTDNDYVLITNEDNQYVPKFVEYFLNEAKPMTGFVYCNTVHSYLKYETLVTRVKENYIDMGSFAVRLPIAQKVGFNHTHLSADGKYAEECFVACKKAGLMVVHINKSLFIHN